MERERFLLAMAIWVIFAYFIGTSVVSAQTGSLSFGQPVCGCPGQIGVHIPVIYTSSVDLCAFQSIIDLEEGVLTFADPPVDTVGTVSGEFGPFFLWMYTLCDPDSQWMEVGGVVSITCDRLIPAEPVGDTLFYIVVDVNPNATPGTVTSLDLRDSLCGGAENLFEEQDQTWFHPALIDGNFQVTTGPNIVLLPNVPDENQPPPSNSTNWCAPTAAVNIIDYWDRVVQHPNAVGAMDNWTRGQASDHLGWFMDTNNQGSPLRGNDSDGHPGTYVKDEGPGINDFLLWDTTYTFNYGKPDTSKKRRCWQINTDQTIGWPLYKTEIDSGRPLKVDFIYWNPISTGITVVDTASGDTITVYSWGDTVNISTDPEEQWPPNSDIGHAVTGVGYILSWDPDGSGPLPATNWVIVHDNWPSTAKNVAIPWANWLASITVDPNPPPRAVLVYPVYPHWTGSIGDTVNTTWDIFNVGYEPDEYQILLADSLGWGVSPDPPVVVVNPCGGGRVDGPVVIPPTAPAGTVNRITLTAFSITEPWVRDSASVAVTVWSELFGDDFNDCDISDWEVHASDGIFAPTDEQYLSPPCGLKMVSQGDGYAYGKTPEFNLDTSEDYTISFWFKVPNSNNHWFLVMDNNQVHLVIDYGTDLKTWDGVAAQLVKALSAGQWYFIECKAHPSQGNYDIYVDGELLRTANFFNPNAFSYLRIGDIHDGSYDHGEGFWDDVQVAGLEVGIEAIEAARLVPNSYSLSQNYPNPFNPLTEIKYALPRDSYVRLEVFNILGEEVTTLVDGEQKAGYKTARWDAENMASGIYFYRLQAGDFTSVRKMILLK